MVENDERIGTSDNFGTGINYHEWGVETFMRLFKRMKGAKEDDWKAVVWAYGGPWPSKVTTTKITPVNGGKRIRLTWDIAHE